MCLIELVDHPKLDRKKKPKAEGESTGATDPVEPVAADPFSKMRKMFGGGKKAAATKEAAPKAEKAPKAKAEKTATAAKSSAKKKTAK
jgi:hypothetical protein